MIKTKSLLILISTLLFSNYYLSFSQELTITTYYPSPVGIYKELRAKRMAIGDNYYNPSRYSWGSEIPSDADLIVEGKVGIKTENPQEELHVAGDTEIEGGVVIGNPTGGNKGAGTINAEKIYVDGSEIGGQPLHCAWYKNSCPNGWVNENSPVDEKSKITVAPASGFLGTVKVDLGYSAYICADSCKPVPKDVWPPGLYCCQQQYPETVDVRCSMVKEGCSCGWCENVRRCECYSKPLITYLWCCPPE